MNLQPGSGAHRFLGTLFLQFASITSNDLSGPQVWREVSFTD